MKNSDLYFQPGDLIYVKLLKHQFFKTKNENFVHINILFIIKQTIINYPLKHQCNNKIDVEFEAYECFLPELNSFGIINHWILLKWIKCHGC